MGELANIFDHVPLNLSQKQDASTHTILFTHGIH